MWSSPILFGFFLILNCAFFQLKAQIPGTKIYAQVDGFPGSTGYIVSQDQRGFIWVGTNNGVTRFNGKHFETFDAFDGLKDKEILSATTAGDSTVIFSPLLNKFSFYHHGHIYTDEHHPEFKQIKNRHINKVQLDKATGIIWISDSQNQGEVFKMGSNSLQKVQIDIYPAFEIDEVWNNQLYISIDTNLKDDTMDFFRYKIDAGTIDRFVFDKPPLSESRPQWSNESTYLTILGRNEHELFIYKRNGVDMTQICYFKSDKSIREVFIDKNDDLWACYNEGAVGYYGHLGSESPLRDPIILLKGKTVNHVFTDKDNNQWFTTQSQGLHFISARHWNSAMIARALGISNNSSKNIGTDHLGRIVLPHQDPSKLTFIDHKSHTVSSKNAISFDGFKRIQPTSDGIAFGNGQRLHILRFSSLFSFRHQSIRAVGDIKSLSLDVDRNLLMATHFAAHKVDLQRFDSDTSGQVRSLYTGRTSCIISIQKGSYYIGTANGLLLLVEKNGLVQKVEDPFLQNANITTLNQLAPSKILVGTSTQGVFIYQPEAGVKAVSDNAQLRNSYIKQIHIQNDYVLWAATDHGVFRMVFDSTYTGSKVDQYTYSDGLPSNEVHGVLVRRDTLYTATSEGIGIFPLNELIDHSKDNSKIFIAQALYGDTIVPFPKKISLQYPNTDLTVRLNTIAFDHLGDVQYRYRLNGWSTKWMVTEGTEINFNGLRPGLYDFEVASLKQKGEQVPNTASLSIEVIPRFWQSRWFQTSLILFSLIGLVLITAFSMSGYKRKLYQKSQQKRRLAELELEAIKAQINPHFIANCLNSVQYFHASKQHEKASQYLDLFAQLIQATLQYSQETFISVREEIRFLSNYLRLEKMRFGDRLQYQVTSDATISGDTLIPALLIQPYVENALKHGLPKPPNKGNVTVKFSRKDNHFIEVVVMDNGPGIAKETKNGRKSHLGLRLAGGRASSYKELFGLDIDLKIEQKNSKNSELQGTSIVVTIPKTTHTAVEI